MNRKNTDETPIPPHYISVPIPIRAPLPPRLLLLLFDFQRTLFILELHVPLPLHLPLPTLLLFLPRRFRPFPLYFLLPPRSLFHLSLPRTFILLLQRSLILVPHLIFILESRYLLLMRFPVPPPTRSPSTNSRQSGLRTTTLSNHSFISTCPASTPSRIRRLPTKSAPLLLPCQKSSESFDDVTPIP